MFGRSGTVPPASDAEATMAGEIEARLKALDLALPEAKAAIGSYVPFLHLDRLLFISGQLPMRDGKLAFAGRLGADTDRAVGQAGGTALRDQHSVAGEGRLARSRPHRAARPPQRLRQRNARLHRPS